MDTVLRKASGETQEFSKEKLLDSLERAGASKSVATETLNYLEQALTPTTTAEQIYIKTLAHLREENPEIAAKYSLKRAIMELGPSGYAFEQFLGRILEEHGFEVYVGRILKGDCIDHEVDVTAKRSDLHIMVEAKYHNRPGIRTGLKVAMYTYARFLDVKKDFVEGSTHPEIPHVAWLVTNTGVTTSAIQYAECKGMNIVAWRYPEKRGLEYYIESQRLYPVTVLSSLPKKGLRNLHDNNLMFAKDLVDLSEQQLAKTCDISSKEAAILYKEVQLLVTE